MTRGDSFLGGGGGGGGGFCLYADSNVRISGLDDIPNFNIYEHDKSHA